MVNRVFLWTLRVLVRWRQIAERRGNKTPSWAVAKQLATNIYVRTSTFLESTRFRFSFTFLAKFVGKKFLSNDERSRARIKAIHIEEEKFAFDIRFVRLIAHILMNKAFRNDSVYRVFRGRTRNFPDTACLVRETIRSNPIESNRAFDRFLTSNHRIVGIRAAFRPSIRSRFPNGAVDRSFGIKSNARFNSGILSKHTAETTSREEELVLTAP